jgi:hypothetical protein
MSVVEEQAVGAHLRQLEQTPQHDLAVRPGDVQPDSAWPHDRFALPVLADPVGIEVLEGLLGHVPVVGHDLQSFGVSLVDYLLGDVPAPRDELPVDGAVSVRQRATVERDRQRGRPPRILVTRFDVPPERARAQRPEADGGPPRTRAP